MDIIDHAQELDQEFQQKALEAHKRRKNFAEPPEVQLIVDGIAYCLDCDEDIDPARLKARPDAVRCVECQGKKERR